MVREVYLDDRCDAEISMTESLGTFDQGFAPRKLDRRQARLEQLLYWSRKSVPERLAAATELTRRMYKMRGIDINERKTDFTPSRVRRRQG
jgi:hypothetical protein